MNVLGIDWGAEHVGLAIVSHPENQVLWALTVHPRTDIKGMLQTRAQMRRMRRNNLRYRKPKVPERSVKELPNYKHATGLNTNLHIECKHVDKETGEICGKHTPMKKNVKPLLLECLVRNLDVSDEDKNIIKSYLDNSFKKEKSLSDFLNTLKIKKPSKNQIKDIITGKLDGRTAFCTKHILLHYTQVDIKKRAYWLAPSLRQKQLDVLQEIRNASKQFQIDKAVIEHARFDIQKIQNGEVLEPEGYQQGPRWKFRNTLEALKYEYENKCAFCGKKIGADDKPEVEHVIPKSKGGGDTWDNLILACKKCNEQKSGRTPQEAGMKIKINKKPLNDSRAIRYMTNTDIGVRKRKEDLKMVLGPIQIEERFGYQTARWRNKWELPKEHYSDAAVLASRWEEDAPKPNLPANVSEVEKKSKGKQLLDSNPVQFVEGKGYFQSISVDGFQFEDVEKIVDIRKKEILSKKADSLKCNDDKLKAFTKKHLREIPFKSVVIEKKDCQKDGKNVREKNGHHFKVAGYGQSPYEAILVYEKTDGTKDTFILRNRKIFRNDVPLDCKKIIHIFKKGYRVKFSFDGKDAQGCIKKLGWKGTLVVQVEEEDKIVTRKATSFTPL